MESTVGLGYEENLTHIMAMSDPADTRACSVHNVKIQQWSCFCLRSIQQN